MTGSFFAEVLKLRKRPAVLLLGGLWLAIVIVFLYLFPALILAVIAPSEPVEAGVAEEQLSTLAPENLPLYLLLFLFPGLGTAMALILGALVAGSEYGWGTLRIILSQRSSRLGVLSGKLLALCVLLLLFVLAAFLAGALSSLAVALFSSLSPAPPPAAELLQGLGAGLLILALWAALGFALATLFEGTTLAVGLGLIYAFVVEQVLKGLSNLSESLRTVLEFLPGVNTAALSQAFVDPAGNPALQEGLISPARAILVMLLYTAAFVLVAALVFRRRDVM
ncbi:MAG: ABC transporter permease subunit [Actinomycetota bacterium]|nr:ABC transporter permease subunit [Actinomycetota bacterium]